jgi:glutamate dehydrogenase/leucine dehydrogenase
VLERAVVAVQKLTSTDGFIAFDLDDGPAVGVVRCAPKVLRDGAELLARSTTYAAASFGLQVGGGSAGINAKPEARDEAVAAFVAEVSGLVAEGRWLPGPGVGVTPEDLADLPEAERRRAAFDQTRTAEGAVAAAEAASRGGLDGKRVAVVGAGPLTEAAAMAASGKGATVEPQAEVSADCDVLLVAGKAGVVDHDAAAGVQAGVLVPLTPAPVTARALAVLGRAGVVVVPDFLSTATGLLDAVDPDGGDPHERISAAVASVAGEGTGAWIAAATRAEEHLRTWRDELPFGRPLA